MALIVKKFGGSSVATPDKMRAIVQRVLKGKQPEDKIVIVVSAMGDTTDELVALAKQITSKTYGREMDMLLTTGEQVSIALMAMAFQEAGQKAISFTGAQAGIKTSDAFNKGRILALKPGRIMKALDQGNIVIVAGFQGINRYDDLTTLGRGGSDTSAVAIAAALHADKCQIFTDVEGVYTADPRKVKNARKLKEITYDEMLELATLGAQVLNNRSVEMAKKYSVELEVLSSLNPVPGTIVKEVAKMEKMLIRGVTKDKDVALVSVLGVEDNPGVAFNIFSKLSQKNINVDIILQSFGRDGTKDIVFTVSKDNGPVAVELLKESSHLQNAKIVCDTNVAKVSIVGAGMESHPGTATAMFEALYERNINIRMISTSEIKISVIIDADDADRAVSAVHAKFLPND